jgi:hypothetical protein
MPPPTRKIEMGFCDLVHDFAGSRVKFSVPNKIINVVPAVHRPYISANANTSKNSEHAGASLSNHINSTPLNVGAMTVDAARAALQTLINNIMGVVTPVVFDLPIVAGGLETTPANEIKVFVEGSNQLSALFKACYPSNGSQDHLASNLVAYCNIATLADSATSLINDVYKRKIRFIKGPYDVAIPANLRPGQCSQQNISYRITGYPVHLGQRPGPPGQVAINNPAINQAYYDAAPNDTIFFFNGNATYSCNVYFDAVRLFPDVTKGFNETKSGPSLSDLAAKIPNGTTVNPFSRQCYDTKTAGDSLQLWYFYIISTTYAYFMNSSFLLTLDILCAHIGKYVYNARCLSIKGGSNTNYKQLVPTAPPAGILVGGKRVRQIGGTTNDDTFYSTFVETAILLWQNIFDTWLYRETVGMKDAIDNYVLYNQEEQLLQFQTTVQQKTFVDIVAHMSVEIIHKLLDIVDIAFEEACNAYDTDVEIEQANITYNQFMSRLFGNLPNDHTLIQLCNTSTFLNNPVNVTTCILGLVQNMTNVPINQFLPIFCLTAFQQYASITASNLVNAGNAANNEINPTIVNSIAQHCLQIATTNTHQFTHDNSSIFFDQVLQSVTLNLIQLGLTPEVAQQYINYVKSEIEYILCNNIRSIAIPVYLRANTEILTTLLTNIIDFIYNNNSSNIKQMNSSPLMIQIKEVFRQQREYEIKRRMQVKANKRLQEQRNKKQMGFSKRANNLAHGKNPRLRVGNRNGGTRRNYKKLKHKTIKQKRKNATLHTPKTRSTSRRLRRVLRRSHGTRKKASRVGHRKARV